MKAVTVSRTVSSWATPGREVNGLRPVPRAVNFTVFSAGVHDRPVRWIVMPVPLLPARLWMFRLFSQLSRALARWPVFKWDVAQHGALAALVDQVGSRLVFVFFDRCHDGYHVALHPPSARQARTLYPVFADRRGAVSFVGTIVLAGVSAVVPATEIRGLVWPK